MRQDVPLTLSRQWLWIAGAWLALALFDATKTVGVMRSEGMHHNWPVLFAIEALSWLPWPLATALIVWLARRLPRLGRSSVTWLAHAAAGIAIDVTFSAWISMLVIEFQPTGPPDVPAFLPHWLNSFYDNLLTTAILYACILMILSMVESRDRLAAHKTEIAQLNEQLAQAQLSALRRQVEPHFLFNSLNAVSSLVRQGRTEAAVDMIASLSDFLRRTLVGSNRQEVSLRDEIEFVQRYLAIQKARFADRLRVELDVPPELGDAFVPNLILQPLVENAVKHGISKRNGGTVRVSAVARDELLVLLVWNDGPGLPEESQSGDTGVGVSNVRSRLHNLYGDAARFELSERRGGVEVSLAIPLRSGLALSQTAAP